jgi:membrane protein
VTEIHRVLTTSHSGLVTNGAVFAIYFSSSGIESLVLRLESIGFVLLSAIAMWTVLKTW